MSSETLDYLFPTPSLPPSRLSPAHHPGVSPHSTESLRNVLKDNHTKWHIFFNEKRFHNHAAHRAIAIWALGADGSVIEKGYKKDIDYEKPAFKSPGNITTENFEEHLGDDEYFQAYMEFFTCHIKDKGITWVLEEFIFSRKANLGTSSAKAQMPADKQPQMLSRFLGGVLHPMIHTGYGAEFNLPGMIVEGLAETAVHIPSPDLLVPLALFEDEPSLKNQVISNAGDAIGSAFSNTVSALDSAFDKVLHIDKETIASRDAKSVSSSAAKERAKDETSGSSMTKPTSLLGMAKHGENVHALSILARIARDSQFASSGSSEKDETRLFDSTVEKHGKAIAEYVKAWTIDKSKLSEGDMEINQKIEEVVWVIVVLYGVGGWTGRKAGSGGQFNADFFLMHLVTSSIFLPSLTALLTPTSQVRLLRSYLTVALTWYVARGRPAFDIQGFYSHKFTIPSGLHPDPKKGGVPDKWIPLMQSGMVHPDEHLTKTQRSLAGWAANFGTRRARAIVKKSEAPKNSNSEEPSPGIGVGGKAQDLQTAQAEGAGLGLGPDIDLGRRVKYWESNNTKPAAPQGTGAADAVQGKQSAYPYPPSATLSQAHELPPPQGDAIPQGDAVPAYSQTRAHTSSTQKASEGDDMMPHTELPGSEFLDGTLFLRVGMLTAARMGWVREGQKEGDFWDFKGFFDTGGDVGGDTPGGGGDVTNMGMIKAKY
ncbi:hypothetical protein B0H34DRAFT_728509 [Crassisporium funariophilum]|nr:hypothetical protein B0H34DRAFT_728509 [Crassisporium funariophilum]